jgi:adenylate kinase family enzyme
MAASQLPGSRIAVVGTSGSGKTYVAAALARILNVPYISNDAIIWRPNWQETPRDEVYAEVDAATAASAWTYDGNLGPSPNDQLVLSRCDTLVWLDLPRWQVWSSITRRTWGRAWTRKPLWHGNTESWRQVFSRDSMIWWSVRTYARHRRKYAAMFADAALADRTRIRFQSRGEVNRWLHSLGDVVRLGDLDAE